MSVALGLDPAGLLALDGPMFDALLSAAERRWTALDEGVATLVELVQLQRRDFHAAFFKGRPPEVKRVERPNAPKPPTLSPAAFVFEYGPDREAHA